MRRFRLVVFGELPIASKVAEWINTQNELELVCGVPANPNAHNNDPFPDVPMFEEYCKENGIKLCRLSELESYADNGFDLGLSCRFSKIFTHDVISMFKTGIINMHGGLLPEVGGLYSSNYSLLLGHKKGGGTLHWINEGIDTGDIIRRCEFDITPDDTAYTVFQKTQRLLYENIIKIILPVLKGELKEFQNQKELIAGGYEHHYFRPGSIDEHKHIDVHDDPEKILRTVKAFDFPGYEPAYFVINGRKVYLRTDYR